MRILLAADVFPPLRISGAVQLRDLTIEMVRQGIDTTVITPEPRLDRDWVIEDLKGVRVVRLKARAFRDLGYVQRTLGEMMLPFAMLKSFRKSPLASEKWDGLVWYSPSIFLGPLASALKKQSGCRGYLILRDIFPEWAVDLGLLRRGPPYWFFKVVENYLYSVADVIGVQSAANLQYISSWMRPGRKVEVLQNWLADAADEGCSISVADTTLAGRRIFLYVGNMGVAQGAEHLIDLVDSFRQYTDVGFLFVGRGSNAKRLQVDCDNRGLDNIVFHEEIDPSEIAGLCRQCHVGLVALDPRHRTHNIPGKFLTYLRNGLPVLANINPGNDLAHLIDREGVGEACTDGSIRTLAFLAHRLLGRLDDPQMANRCRTLAEGLFSPASAVKQIVRAFEH